eukprot:scaffold1890_cov49-Attheya_sp.AAC.2
MNFYDPSPHRNQGAFQFQSIGCSSPCAENAFFDKKEPTPMELESSRTIFRQGDREVDEYDRQCTGGVMSPPVVSRANPIVAPVSYCPYRGNLDENEDDHEMSMIDSERGYAENDILDDRVISPYPYSPTTEELEECQQIPTQALQWTVNSMPIFSDGKEPSEEENKSDFIKPIFSALPSSRTTVDYSTFFDSVPTEDENFSDDDLGSNTFDSYDDDCSLDSAPQDVFSSPEITRKSSEEPQTTQTIEFDSNSINTSHYIWENKKDEHHHDVIFKIEKVTEGRMSPAQVSISSDNEGDASSSSLSSL